MIAIALLFACASEPLPSPESEEVPAQAVVEAEPEPFLGPVPPHARCTFGDGTEAQVGLVSRWPATLDFTHDGETLRIGPDTPGWEPYEYTGDEWYAFSVSFEAEDAEWVYSVTGLARDYRTLALARTRDGVTDSAVCTR